MYFFSSPSLFVHSFLVGLFLFVGLFNRSFNMHLFIPSLFCLLLSYTTDSN